MSILEEIITPEVDKNIISFFESKYIPTVIGFSRTEAGIDSEPRWHYDGGPEKHLILMVYLTDSETDGSGTTLFVNKQASEQLAACGYAYISTDKRLGDDIISLLANHFKIDSNR